jgi:nitrogen fixation/metabolism regulation signal transduction histidine kinase
MNSKYSKEYSDQEINRLDEKINTLENIFLDILREVKDMKRVVSETKSDIDFANRVESCILDSGIVKGVSDLDDKVDGKL